MNKKSLIFIISTLIWIDSFGQFNKSWYASRQRKIFVENSQVKLEPFIPPPLTLFTQDNNNLTHTVDSSIRVYMSHYFFTMCDSSGQIQFFTNGLRVYNRLGKIMENGDSINLCVNSNQLYPPPFFRDEWLHIDTLVGAFDGYFNCSAIPYPGKPKEYLLIYSCSYYNSINEDVMVINYAHINMNVNQGFGKVISKEITILKGKYLGHPVLFKHGNGKDWWMLTYTSYSNEFYFYLIDNTGVKYFNKKIRGPAISGYSSIYQNKISPDGQFFAKIDQCSNVSLYSIDRCEGNIEFINTIYVDYEFENCPFFNKIACEGNPTCIRGIEFSPNSKLLYIVKARFELFQISLSDFNISKIYKSTTGISLNQCQIMQDNRIYIDNLASGNNSMNVIRRPKLKGLCSDMDFGSYYIESQDLSNRIESFPNYLLGSIKGSVCDSL